VCQEVELAFTFLARFRGLMLKSFLSPHKGILLSPCSSVHMFFMRFAIDAVFIDKNWRVVGVEDRLKPWCISKYYPAAYYVLELPAGRATQAGITVGDCLEYLP